jgi:transposase
LIWLLSTGASPGVCTSANGGAMSQVMVFSGAERRRRWRTEEKRALVEAAFAPGAVVSDVARQADIQAGQIYRWRHELLGSQAVRGSAFAEVRLAGPSPVSEPLSVTVVVVEIGGATVRIGATAPERLVTAILRALAK